MVRYWGLSSSDVNEGIVGGRAHGRSVEKGQSLALDERRRWGGGSAKKATAVDFIKEKKSCIRRNGEN